MGRDRGLDRSGDLTTSEMTISEMTTSEMTTSETISWMIIWDDSILDGNIWDDNVCYVNTWAWEETFSKMVIARAAMDGDRGEWGEHKNDQVSESNFLRLLL